MLSTKNSYEKSYQCYDKSGSAESSIVESFIEKLAKIHIDIVKSIREDTKLQYKEKSKNLFTNLVYWCEQKEGDNRKNREKHTLII